MRAHRGGEGILLSEVYHGIEYKFLLGNYPNGHGGLFTSYVNDNMAEKIYASGFPAHVKTDEEKKGLCKEYDSSESEKVRKESRKESRRQVDAQLLMGKVCPERLQTEVVVNPLKVLPNCP